MTDDETTPEPTPAESLVEFPEEYVAEVRSAEAAHQRSITTYAGKRPDELDQALELRVAANLAQADGKTVARVGGQDQQVRELEQPYLQRKPASAEPTHGGHQRRSSKKPTPKKGTN